MAWGKDEKSKFFWESVRDFLPSALPMIAAVALVLFYVFRGHKIVLKGAAKMMGRMESDFPAVWSKISPAAGAAIYAMHIAIPVSFILILLLALIGNGKGGNVTTERPAKGLGWVWIAGVIGLAAPFVLPELLKVLKSSGIAHQ